VYNNTGESPLYFSQFDTPQTNYGNASDMNGEKGYHFFSTLVWRIWTITAAFSAHDQIQPISWGPTIFNDRGTQNTDQRNFVDAVYALQIGGGTLRWRTYYDSYHYQGRFEYRLNDGTGIEDNRQNAFGDWVGTQLTYRFRTSPAGDFTVGAESKIDIPNLQTDADVSPVPFQYLSTSNPDRTIAFIAQDEKRLSKRWKLDLELRIDKSRYHPDFVSPRAALSINVPSGRTSFSTAEVFGTPARFSCSTAMGFPP
jgi:hypothetical protein